MKISTRTQILLRPKNLDPRIIKDLDLDPIADVAPTHLALNMFRAGLVISATDLSVEPVNTPNGTHDLIDDLLRANRTSTDLEELQRRATDRESS